jgi:hypothetical protein
MIADAERQNRDFTAEAQRTQRREEGTEIERRKEEGMRGEFTGFGLW